jgi:hypothetical protein
MAATNFQVELAANLPSGNALIQLVNKPSVFPPLGFSLAGLDSATYPSSGTPGAPTFGLGGIHVSSWSIDAAYDTDRVIFTAPAACQLVKVVVNQTVVEATSATTTLLPRKVASGQAIGTGVGLFAAALNLKTGVVANTPLTGVLTATAADLVFAAGDWLGLDFTNALTEYIGCADFFFCFI